MLRAVPLIISMAISTEFALRSFILSSAISFKSALVTLPTFSLLGSPDPLGTPAFFFRRTAAGGVFVMNVKLLSA